MKVTITKVDGAYYLNKEGAEAQKLTVKQPNGWDPTIFLPDDIVRDFNRKLINTITLDKKLANGEFELTVKAPTAPITRTGTTRKPKTPDTDFLTPEEAAQYKALQDKIAEARKEASKPVELTPLEKAKRAKEKADAALAALMAEAETAEKAEQEAEKPKDEPKVESKSANKGKGKGKGTSKK